MPGEKRRLEDEGGGVAGGLSFSLSDELHSLSQISKKKRAEKAPGLDDRENFHLVPDDSLFIKSMKAAGFYVKQKDKENILIEDQAIFTKKLKEEITNSRDYPKNVRWGSIDVIKVKPDNSDVKYFRKMLDTLTGWLNEDQTFLIKCLRPTKTGSKCSTARSSMQVEQENYLEVFVKVEHCRIVC